MFVCQAAFNSVGWMLGAVGPSGGQQQEEEEEEEEEQEEEECGTCATCSGLPSLAAPGPHTVAILSLLESPSYLESALCAWTRPTPTHPAASWLCHSTSVKASDHFRIVCRP